ncbi:hypothetical protein LCGC14_2899970 [marine sediment metagenome]|uniref:Uncharacterized protein n=1 Tax=marine sediment metagenome TaxID=412755 RepID=A0A0F8XUN4_9ZZZZ
MATKKVEPKVAYLACTDGEAEYYAYTDSAEGAKRLKEDIGEALNDGYKLEDITVYPVNAALKVSVGVEIEVVEQRKTTVTLEG